MLLPITNYKNEIIEAVRSHSFTIISAETGSGKSTQIPQYLADYYEQVIVTEPRIMAAKTLAKRVAEEMEVTLGQEVGYRTAFDKCSSPNSNILYCTDGLQLIRTIFSEDNKTKNVLVIDEVHEWNLNIETLVAWCKFMQGKWNTKVVLMSATLDTDGLSEFFGNDVAVLNIPGNLYEVSMEQRHQISLIDTINENINCGKNILVFVPGKKEIADVIYHLDIENAMVLPLHGELDWEDQKKCFKHYPVSKVIVATNVAQTSITIPDIDVVVDTGEARISIAENGIQGLFLKPISRSDIMQRKGRAGRTKSGKYFLCSDIPMKYREEYSVPEIQRSILDRVVLQLATIGIDAEELEFFHQPDLSEIKLSKKTLTDIGAFSEKQVTAIGRKIVKMPVSVQVARMIVEAEKYGVTEQVITIASIIENGGLLSKEGKYNDFTSEYKSDLLAELDVWKSINQMKYIDFQKLGINKRTFFRVKENIQKLKEALAGIVELTHNNDREAVVKSCLYGLVSHIYVRDYDNMYYSEDGSEVRLDRKSCVSYCPQIIVGIPKTIEFKDMYGCTDTMDLVNFVSKIDVSTLIELVPNKVIETTSLRYSASEDAVEVTINRSFLRNEIDYEIIYDYFNPQYSELKAKYEEEMRNKNYSRKQRVVMIDGKQFEVEYNSWEKRGIVYLDSETLFTTNVKELKLDSGEKVHFALTSLYGRRETNIVALKNAVEMNRIKRLREGMRKEYDVLKVNTITDAIANASRIGKVELTMNNGGYGDTPIFVYGYIELKKNKVTFRIGDDENVAKSNTLEALQYLFMKEIEKRYGENKFSHQKGKKKQILTESEREVKEDFYSFVREVLANLTIENALENLEFLEEYYQEVIK
ncbi:MAG: hypothetical protein BHW02_03100 [Clostridium sp. 28_12]|nr:MAG: hypothetical protein BHW02_03100 [Clostridium sp. 28_12]